MAAVTIVHKNGRRRVLTFVGEPTQVFISYNDRTLVSVAREEQSGGDAVYWVEGEHGESTHQSRNICLKKVSKKR